MIAFSRTDMELLADSIITDYRGSVLTPFSPVDVDRLASEYLGLDVSYMDFPQDSEILGLTAYSQCCLHLKGQDIPLNSNTVLLAKTLKPGERGANEGRRRFTLAHECAHQILYRYESAVAREEICRPYACRRAFSLRELKTHEDWNEWQADALGAALLMPEELVRRVVYLFTPDNKLTRYGDWFPPEEYRRLDNMSRFLGVSHSALLIRLKQLGLLEQKRSGDYRNPLDVVAA